MGAGFLKSLLSPTHRAPPEPPGRRNCWGSSSRGGWGPSWGQTLGLRAIPWGSGSFPGAPGHFLGLLSRNRPVPAPLPPPSSDRCHFSPPLVSKCFLRQLLVIIGIFGCCYLSQPSGSELGNAFAGVCPGLSRTSPRGCCVHRFGIQASLQLDGASSRSPCFLFRNYPLKIAQQ